MSAWVEVKHDSDPFPDVSEFIGPFPAAEHAAQWRERVLPYPQASVVEVDGRPDGVVYTLKEAETMLKARF